MSRPVAAYIHFQAQRDRLMTADPDAEADPFSWSAPARQRVVGRGAPGGPKRHWQA